MCDFDDFEDGGDYMDEDSFENQMDDPFADESELGESNQPEQDNDEFTERDAYFIGSIFGNAYEEGLDEKKRRELKRKAKRKIMKKY